ncbi:MAG: hypothetical protein EBR82_88610, partial [Caulobacteraceae bacterium]|nr:hypothetical protein [Caulobacteraceae bacterium]
RSRGGVSLNTAGPKDYRDYFVASATAERLAALAPAQPAPTLAEALAVPEVRALVEALKVSAEVLSQCSFQTIRINRQYIDREEVVANSISALRQIGGEA